MKRKLYEAIPHTTEIAIIELKKGIGLTLRHER